MKDSAKTILLVEDEALIAMTEAEVLEKYDFNVIPVYNAKRAIQLVNEHDIDLILMDIDLGKGKMDGAEAAQIILRDHDIPVVFLSSHTEPEIVKKAEGITSYGYILKGSSESVINASINMAFRLHDAYAEKIQKTKQLNTLLDNAEDLIGRLDRSGKHLYVNQALCNIMGIPYEEYIGKSLEELGGSPELISKLEDALDKVFTSGEAVQIEFTLTSAEANHALECKIVPELVENGEVKTVVAISRDITERKRIEDELREREESFKKAFSTEHIAMAVSRQNDGMYLEANPGFLKMTGYEREEIIGHTSQELRFFLPSQRQKLIKDISRYGQLHNQELTFPNKIGEYRTVLFSIGPIVFKNQGCFLATMVDITDRKRMEEELKEREVIFNAAQEIANIGSFVWDLRTDSLEWSHNMFAIAGLDPDAFYGNLQDTITYLIHPEDRESVENQIEDMISRRETRPMEFRLIRPDGDIRWLRSAAKFVFDENGEPIVSIGVHRDTTEQHKAEAALRESERQKNIILNSSAEMIAYYSRDLKIMWANRTSAESVGRSMEELIGMHCYEIWHQRATPCDDCPVLRARDEKSPQQSEQRTPDGRYWYLRGYPVLDEHGEVEALVEFGQDITKRKLSEESLRESEEKHRLFIENFTGIAYQTSHLTFSPFFFAGMVEDITGYKAEDFLNGRITWMDLIYPEDMENVRKLGENVRDKPDYVADGEYRIFTKSGEIRWVRDLGRAVREDKGQLSIVQGAIYDITDRKEAEERLKESETRLKEIIDKLPIPIVISKGESEILVFINKKFTEVFGFTPEDLPDVAHWWEKAYPDEEYRSQVRRSWTNNMNTAIDEDGELEPLEVDVTCKDGSSRHVLVTAHTLGFLHIIVFMDLTDRNIIQKNLEKSLQEKDFLMKELNHRVKNNLAMVSSLINLKKSVLGGGVDLSDVGRQIDAIRIIHDKLYQSDNITHINIKEYLDDLLNTVFSFENGPVQVDLVTEIKDLHTKTAVPLGIIVNEIATNAIKHGFNNEENAVFSVSLKRDEDRQQYVLKLSNTGNPFPENVDIENPTSLGLRLISALAEQLAGGIELIRKPHPEFIIRFPIEK